MAQADSAEMQPPAPRIEDFSDDPTRSLDDWRWLWHHDVPFPIVSHRGPLGRLLVIAKRLLRPLVTVPQNDLWQRQRTFNLILLEHLAGQGARQAALLSRLGDLEAKVREGIEDVTRHNDALFSRLDQKLDRLRREAREHGAQLRAALAVAGEGAAQGAIPGAATAALARAEREAEYLALERRHRGTEDELRARLAVYLPILGRAGVHDLLDLGCGRGEALVLFREHGIRAVGIDGSAEMVRVCRERGLDAEHGDLIAALRARPAATIDAVVSFHVVEHLDAAALEFLPALAWRVLRPGGLLILESPSPLSLVAGARNFWLDPTHRRPIHPGGLEIALAAAGFRDLERLDLNPFPDHERLPEIDLDDLAEPARPLADAVNRLRDRLDDLLYGARDFALIARR